MEVLPGRDFVLGFINMEKENRVTRLWQHQPRVNVNERPPSWLWNLQYITSYLIWYNHKTYYHRHFSPFHRQYTNVDLSACHSTVQNPTVQSPLVPAASNPLGDPSLRAASKGLADPLKPRVRGRSTARTTTPTNSTKKNKSQSSKPKRASTRKPKLSEKAMQLQQLTE